MKHLDGHKAFESAIPVSPRVPPGRLVLPLIALGGYAFIAAGAGFAVVRWIKTAENATDYSIMNTARQLLWLPTTRAEKYKAKQAIDTFFVRMGDVISAAVVFVGTGVLHLAPHQFAVANVMLTLTWLVVALLILRPREERLRMGMPRLAGAGAAARGGRGRAPVPARRRPLRTGLTAAGPVLSGPGPSAGPPRCRPGCARA